jgi:predicted nuclease of predicted toxin-antitoxin system
MAKPKLPFTKQKLFLYFDENCPALAIDHFKRSSYWKKKIKALSAIELGNKGRNDKFHFDYCNRNGYILVSLDNDFADDTRYPFSFGKMAGVIIVKASKGDLRRFMVVLSRLLISSITSCSQKIY